MGQIRTPDCQLIDQELRVLVPEASEIETLKDDYSLDYMVWITVNGDVYPIRITVEEYRDGDWKPNVALAVRMLLEQAQL
jgi:hypothetical protein